MLGRQEIASVCKVLQKQAKCLTFLALFEISMSIANTLDLLHQIAESDH
jgi:hypothetical protein